MVITRWMMRQAHPFFFCFFSGLPKGIWFAFIGSLIGGDPRLILEHVSVSPIKTNPRLVICSTLPSTHRPRNKQGSVYNASRRCGEASCSRTCPPDCILITAKEY